MQTICSMCHKPLTVDIARESIVSVDSDGIMVETDVTIDINCSECGYSDLQEDIPELYENILSCIKRSFM